MRPPSSLRQLLGFALLLVAPAADAAAEDEAVDAGMSAESPNASVTTYSSSCYSCTTVNFNHRLFSSLESANESEDRVIPGSCYLITSDACHTFDPCASLTVCGVDPHSSTAACAFGGCIGCHLYATCIDETGHCRPEMYKDCGAADACADVEVSGNCGF